MDPEMCVPPPLSHAEILERDGNRCARCGRRDRALDVHHRRLRSHGRDELASNRVCLCRFCHGWVHGHPEWARIAGWIVTEGADPASVPVHHWMWPAGPVLLEDDGGIRIYVDLPGVAAGDESLAVAGRALDPEPPLGGVGDQAVLAYRVGAA